MIRAEETVALQRFPVVVKTDCKNIDRIYPLKQKQVSEICSLASRFPAVRKIVVFGSSVTPKCNIDSDLDLCIDADISDGLKIYEIQNAIGKICDWNCDIIMFSNMGNTLRETIQREGVVVYE